MPEFDLDLASLHIRFYLASWGMYRGSAKIRNYDYKIHVEAAQIIVQSKIQNLVHIAEYNKEKIERIADLYVDLADYYRKRCRSNRNSCNQNIARYYWLRARV
jgi:hypothetical protein